MIVEEAKMIVKKMALVRNKTVKEIMAEYAKYNVDGKVVHYWPDENTACKTLMS
jgi:hypothetical protein